MAHVIDKVRAMTAKRQRHSKAGDGFVSKRDPSCCPISFGVTVTSMVTDPVKQVLLHNLKQIVNRLPVQIDKLE